ncbi:hypothetical protein, partial [Mobiluncus mulieris]|uniref:hypothetical protein n=1 Tax=Mobiluncus mulieris TaxID=2052 RepID=UPI001B8D62DA
ATLVIGLTWIPWFPWLCNLPGSLVSWLYRVRGFPGRVSRVTAQNNPGVTDSPREAKAKT